MDVKRRTIELSMICEEWWLLFGRDMRDFQSIMNYRKTAQFAAFKCLVKHLSWPLMVIFLLPTRRIIYKLCCGTLPNGLTALLRNCIKSPQFLFNFFDVTLPLFVRKPEIYCGWWVGEQCSTFTQPYTKVHSTLLWLLLVELAADFFLLPFCQMQQCCCHLWQYVYVCCVLPSQRRKTELRQKPKVLNGSSMAVAQKARTTPTN